MSAPIVFHAKAAYTWKSKIVTLAEEMRRRLRNLDELHTEEEIIEVARKFTQKLTDSGYDERTRMEILKSAVTKHLRQVDNWKRGGPALYRSSEEMKESRLFKS